MENETVNIESNRINFNILGETEICSFVENGTKRVIIAITSLTNKISKTILNSKIKDIQLIVSKRDSVGSRTTEHSDAIELLLKNDFIIRVSETFSLNVLVVDESAWIFAQTKESAINCFIVSQLEVMKLISGLSAKIVNEPVENKHKPELGEVCYTKEQLKEDVQKEKKVIEVKNEIEKIHNLQMEFVEIEFKGLRLATKKIQIPQELTSLGMSNDVKNILSSSARLFDKTHDFSKSFKELEDERRKIREDFLISINEYGAIIQNHVKDDFKKALEELNNKITKVKESIKKSLEDELTKTKKSLINYYLPIAKENPPQILKKLNKNVNNELLNNYLDGILDKTLPDINSLVDEIELQYRFKGLTNDLLKDKKFLDALKNKGVNI